MSILVIPVGKKAYKIDSPIMEEPSLKWLQEKVGGYIEIIRLSPNAQMIVDEEGILKEKDVNLIGTFIYNQANDFKKLINMIVGDVIILTESNVCK